jgi:hypothetical protein
MDGSAIQNPIAVAFGEKDVTGAFDALKYVPIGSSPNTLGCEKARPFGFTFFDVPASPLEPITAQVGISVNAIGILPRRSRVTPGFDEVLPI